MKTETIRLLHQINQEFYQTFAQSFSATRQRIQPGIRRLFKSYEMKGNYLDIGCGNGNLALEWLASGKEETYCGLDFSSELLTQANQSIEKRAGNSACRICFKQADLLQPDWYLDLKDHPWTGAFLFAVLHHIPGNKTRERLCAEIACLLNPEARLFVSVWQVLNSKRLLNHIVSWETINLSPDDIEPGDILMDWRAEPGIGDTRGLRYVHIFTYEELTKLSNLSGFSVESSFYSDGREGNLGLYQVWRKSINKEFI